MSKSNAVQADARPNYVHYVHYVQGSDVTRQIFQSGLSMVAGGAVPKHA